MTLPSPEQCVLFGGTAGVGPLRFTVSIYARRRWSSSFVLAIAEARAAALAGHRPVVIASDGTSAEVRFDAAGGFAVAPGSLSHPSWAAQARQLLADHG